MESGLQLPLLRPLKG
ncbi:hypothetical protein DBR06_SOUSAS14610004, partial [Sousa chinensis]